MSNKSSSSSLRAPARSHDDQAEARDRVAGGGLPDIVAASQRGNAEAVELHFIADAGVVNARGM